MTQQVGGDPIQETEQHPREWYCGANRTKKPGWCHLHAGWGTDHLGEGRCKYHGGATPRGTASPHFKHGRYSKYMKKDLADMMEQLRGEVDLESIDEEILIATALFARQVRKRGQDWLKYARDLLVVIVSFKEKRHRMLYGERVSITLAEAEAFAVTVVNVIDKEVTDPAVKERIYKGIGVPDAILARAGIAAPSEG